MNLTVEGVLAVPAKEHWVSLSILPNVNCSVKKGLRGFPDEMKISFALNFEILGVPIGDPIFCAKSIAEKRAHASKILELLKEVGSVDTQVALLLLRQCGGFCQMVHIAKCTPPSVALAYLMRRVRQTFSDSTCIDPSDSVW